MKRIKKTILIMGGLLLVLLIGLSIFVYTFDANRYKPQITEQVEKISGRKLSIEGDVTLTLFPWIGLSIHQVALANARGFGPEPFARLQSLDVKVKLMPLLKQQLEVDKVRLQGLFLSLQQSRDGLNNWSDLSQATAPQAPAKPDQPAVPAETSTDAPAIGLGALMVNGVEIRDATLRWQDDTTGLSATLDKIKLETGTIRINESIALTLSAHAALNQPRVDIVLDLSSAVRFQPDTMLVDVDDLAMTLRASSDQLPAQNIQLTLESALQARLNQQQFDIGQTRLGIVAKGKDLPGGTLKAELATAAKIDLEKQTASLDRLLLTALGMDIQSRIEVRDLRSEPRIQGQLQLLPMNPKTLAQQLELVLPEMKRSTALSHLALSADFQASARYARLDKLRIEFDQSLLQGGLQAKAFDKPDLAFQLSMDRLILDDYLPPPNDEAAAAVAPLPAPVVGEQDIPIELPTEMLRTLIAEGQFELQTLQAVGHDIQDLKLGLRAANGQLTLPVSMKLLKGALAMTAGLDVRPSEPEYQLQMTAKDLQAAPVINPVLANLLGDDSMTMDGALQMSADILSRGHTLNTLIAKSNGRLKFNMNQAELKGVDAEFFVRKAAVDYMEQKKIATQPDWRGTYNPKQTTAFRVARASANINNGVVSNQDLLLDSSRLKVTGGGKIDLPKQLINYRAEVDLNPAHRDSLLEKMLDIPVPLDVQGGFANPNISMDSKTWGQRVGDVLKQETKEKIQEKVGDKIDEKKDKVKDRLKDKLKGLFDR